MNVRVVKKLAELTLTPFGDVEPRIAAYALEELSRSDLKIYLSELKRAASRQRVNATVPGEPGLSVAEVVGRAFPGRRATVTRDDSLGAGVLLNVGDNRLDASVKGLFHQTVDRLRKT